MTISYVGHVVTDPPNSTSTSVTQTLTAPEGLVGPAVVFAAETGTVTTLAGLPSGWVHVGATGGGGVYAFPWTDGDATSWTITSSGVGAGYVAWDVFAYNGCVLDVYSSVENSEQSPPVTTGTAFDWLVSIFITRDWSAAGDPTLQSSTTVANRFSDRWNITPATNPGTYGIAVADTNSVVAQGTTSGSSYTWSPVHSLITGWGTVTVALSGSLAPSLPTNLTPNNGAFADFSTAQFFSANYNNTDGSTCAAWQFRIRAQSDSNYQYWDAGAGGLQFTTPVWNTGSQPAFTMPGGTLANANAPFLWSFNTQSSSNTTLTSGFAPDFTVAGQGPPAVLSVLSPSGTVTVANPTITWTAAASGTAVLTGYRVTTATSAGTVVDDSGQISFSGTSGSYTTPFLPNNTEYVSTVQVTESGGQVSNITPATQTSYMVAYTVPPAPTISFAIPSLDAAGAPVVVLTIVAPPQSGITGNLSVQVYYTDFNTPVAVPLRNSASIIAAGGTVIIGDYEATFGVPRTYQAYVVSSTDGPSLASTEVTATQNSKNWVLSDPIDPTRFLTLSRLGSTSSSSTSLQAQASIELDRSRAQTIFYPFGATSAVVQYGDVYAPTFTLNFLLQGYEQAKMYDRMWAAARTLQVRSDMGDNWYVDVGASRPLTVLSAGDRPTNPIYVASLNCTVTTKP